MLISELFALIFMILYQNNFLFIFYLFPYKFIHYMISFMKQLLMSYNWYVVISSSSYKFLTTNELFKY